MMIARYKKDVVNNGKRVLFKTTEYAKVSAAYKDFCLSWLGLVFCPEERGEGVSSKRK
jgi:hypothetical protein